MTTPKTTFMVIIIGLFVSFSAAAEEALDATDVQLEVQTLELESADVSALRLATVENQADKNANEIHQESSVGRAGLQALCKCFPDGNGGFYCQ